MWMKTQDKGVEYVWNSALFDVIKVMITFDMIKEVNIKSDTYTYIALNIYIVKMTFKMTRGNYYLPKKRKIPRFE